MCQSANAGSALWKVSEPRNSGNQVIQAMIPSAKFAFMLYNDDNKNVLRKDKCICLSMFFFV